MRALVIYESMFGNTQQIAQAVGHGLSEHGLVEVVEVGAATHEIGPEIDLLVVGAPTHAFGLSRPSTRQDAASRTGSAPVSAGLGIREWLESVGRAAPGALAVAFDTKIDKPVPGAASHAAEKRLRRLGYHLTARAETFRVADTVGPLLPGELERARQWGASLAAAVSSTTHLADVR